jgi:hypothetical protein
MNTTPNDLTGSCHQCDAHRTCSMKSNQQYSIFQLKNVFYMILLDFLSNARLYFTYCCVKQIKRYNIFANNTSARRCLLQNTSSSYVTTTVYSNFTTNFGENCTLIVNISSRTNLQTNLIMPRKMPELQQYNLKII